MTPVLRVLQPKENMSFWKNGHLQVEDDFTKNNFYACILHSPYDKDETRILTCNYGVMYSFKLELMKKINQDKKPSKNIAIYKETQRNNK